MQSCDGERSLSERAIWITLLHYNSYIGKGMMDVLHTAEETVPSSDWYLKLSHLSSVETTEPCTLVSHSLSPAQTVMHKHPPPCRFTLKQFAAHGHFSPSSCIIMEATCAERKKIFRIDSQSCEPC